MRNSRNKGVVGASLLFAAILLGALGGCSKNQSAETLVAEAKQFMVKGDLRAAVIQAKNAAVKDPENVEARLTLGQLYLETGDGVSAEKEIRKALSLGAGKDVALPYLASALLMQQQFQKALDESGADKVTASPALLVLRGDAEAALQKFEPARANYDAALAAKPDSSAAMLGLARLALRQNDAAGASALIERAIAAQPAEPEPLLLKADLQRAQGKAELAIATYDQVLKIRPNHRSAHIEKAYAEISLGKFAEAKADIDAANKISPGNLNVLYAQALLDSTQGKHAAAKESLQKILRVAPEHLPTILLAGSVEMALGSLPQAEQHLKKYHESMPNHLYARKQLAAVKLKLGQTGEAQALLAPALEENPNDTQLLALMGESHAQAREFAKSAEYFEKASALAPNAAPLRTSLAISKLQQGDDARAISELEQSAKLDNKSIMAGMLLAMTELRLKRFDKALAAVGALEAAQPNDPAVQNLKGGIYLAMNDGVNAAASFEKALQLQPTYFPAVANLAQMAMKQNKPEEAKRRLTAFLEKDKKNLSAMRGLAELAGREGRPADVTMWFEKAHAENPQDASAAANLAGHYSRHGDRTKALSLARKFHAANPTNPEMLDMLGRLQIADGDKTGALESFSKLVGVAPKSPMSYYRLAEIHMMLENPTAAADDLKKALALKPDFLEAQLAQVEMAVRGGRPDDALALTRQLQKNRPKDGVGFALEGNLHMRQSKPALAVAAYDKAFALTRTTGNLITLHGAMIAAGKTAEAEARLAAWQKTHPDDPILELYTAELLLTAKRYKGAIAKFEAVIKRAPQNAVAMNNLAWAYQQEKDPRALATAERALALAPNDAAVIDTLGWMLVEQGNTARGLPMLQKAVQLAPGANEVRWHLASALVKSGDKANARVELNKLLAIKGFKQADEAKALLAQL